MENMRLMLHAYSPDMPIYFGSKLKVFVTQGYMSGGAGYVLSREALRRFAEKGLHDDHTCSPFIMGVEDAEMGKYAYLYISGSRSLKANFKNSRKVSGKVERNRW
jgi:glycoprotein-N-acetylgalactosamine 3-beta-galactosyltransferase